MSTPWEYEMAARSRTSGVLAKPVYKSNVHGSALQSGYQQGQTLVEYPYASDIVCPRQYPLQQRVLANYSDYIAVSRIPSNSTTKSLNAVNHASPVTLSVTIFNLSQA